MKRYSLEQLTEAIQADPALVEELFDHHVRNDRYGHAAAAAATAATRTYQQEMALATARATFSGERSNPALNEALMRAYLPVYSKERNQRIWQNRKKVTIGIAAAGLALLVGSLFPDSENARKFLRVGTAAFETAAVIRLLKDYIIYKL